MSLPGYVRKTRPAIWMSVRGAVPVKSLKKPVKKMSWGAIQSKQVLDKTVELLGKNWPAKSRKQIPRRSKVRVKQMMDYVPKMLAFLALNRKCQRCADISTCVHHFAGRRGRQLLVEKDWRASCSACNIFAKEHPKESRAEEWLAPVGEYRT